MDSSRLIVPLVTPFTDDGSAVSEVRLARVMRRLREEGAEGVVVGSDAGEFASLSLAERKRLTEWVLRDAGGMAIYVNITASTTAIAIDLAQDAADTGANGAVLCPPIFGQLTLEEAKNFLHVVRRHGKVPVGWIDPSGQLGEVAHSGDEVTVRSAEPLGDHGLEEWITQPHGSNYEFWSPSGIAHPAGIFGPATAVKILAKWGAFKPIFEGLIRHSGIGRIAKYAMECQGIEVGPMRGPFITLGSTGREAVDHIMRTA